MSKKIFEQTNRTILFEEFSNEKLDLLTLIGSGETGRTTSLNDAKVKEINDHLLVKSFPEFLEKFQPKVYSYFNAANQKVAYLSEKPNGIPEDAITEIPINMENTFFKMLVTLLESKKVNGSINVEFNFKEILNMLSPKKVMDDIKQLRKEISYLHEKYEATEEEDPTKIEIGDKLNIAFEKASKNYNNVLGMLPLAIEDIKTRMMIGSSGTTRKAEEIKIGMLSMNEKGELKIIEEKPKKSKALAVSVKNTKGLIGYFKEDYDEVNDNPTEYVKELVVRTFVPLPSVIEDIDCDKEVGNYNHYLDFYKNAQEDFIKTIKPLMEKILGVKAYFDQYDKTTNGMFPTLLITNNTLEMTLKGENKDILDLYLTTVNQKNDFTNTIWFGIVPNINLDEVKKKRIRQIFKGTDKSKTLSTNTIEQLQILMSVLSRNKITTFFSMAGGDESTFSNLATTGIEKYVEKTKGLQYKPFSEYLVPCIPNFTVIPKEKSSVVLDYKLIMDSEKNAPAFEKEEIVKFWIEGVYVEGSYVGAGLYSSMMCPEFLRNRFKNKVEFREPGVRINLEESDNAHKIITTMSKEITGYTIMTKDSINRNNFGFVFSSDNVQLGNQIVNNITVYKARTLATDDEGVFEPIYKTVTTTYIERILRFLTIDFKEDKIKEFFSNNPKSQKSKWQENKDKINSILRDGDDINCVIEGNTCLLHIMFNGDTKNLSVEITKN